MGAEDVERGSDEARDSRNGRAVRAAITPSRCGYNRPALRKQLARSSPAQLALGALGGAALAGLLAPLVRSRFSPPTGGVGVLTIAQYPKTFDYFVIVAIVIGAFAGGVVAAYVRSGATESEPQSMQRRPRWWPVALVTFVLMCFVHDH